MGFGQETTLYHGLGGRQRSTRVWAGDHTLIRFGRSQPPAARVWAVTALCRTKREIGFFLHALGKQRHEIPTVHRGMFLYKGGHEKPSTHVKHQLLAT